ncbi:MAG: hypothetical protein PUE12_02940 [Oscillospiraceae bacterium]|nr:hypothetical protein [Oscillospiraceae bacterium]
MKRSFTAYVPSSHDEDAEPFADNRLAVVCDGLGGSGQNIYTYEGKKLTSAALGSRRVSHYFKEFFESKHSEIFNENELNNGMIDECVVEFKSTLSEKLNDFVKQNGFKNIVKGKSMQMLPTTLAAVIYKSFEDSTGVLVISSGDSRVYCLTHDKGLQQLSIDDVEEEKDAFQKATTMTNNISQDNNYYIHYNYYQLPKDCIVFAASDGCFDYLDNPMELEFMMCCAIANSCDFHGCDDFVEIDNWLGKSLEEEIKKRKLQSYDDCTVAGFVFGYDKSEDRTAFCDRGKHIAKNYIKPLREIEKWITSSQYIKNELEKLKDEKDSIYNQLIENTKKCISEYINDDIYSPEGNRQKCYTGFMKLKTDYDEFKKEYTYKLIEKNPEFNSVRSEMLKIFEEVYFEKKISDSDEIKKIFNEKNELGKCCKDTFDSLLKDTFDSLLKDSNIFISHDLNIQQDFLKKFIDPINSFLKKLNQFYAKIKLLKGIKEGLQKQTCFEEELSKIIKSENSEESLKKYSGCKDYCNLVNKYYKIKKININDFEDSEKEDFYNSCMDKFINNSFDSLWEKINSDSRFKYIIILDPKNRDKLERLRKIEDRQKEIDKTQYWSEYRKNYELFKSCEIKGEVG